MLPDDLNLFRRFNHSGEGLQPLQLRLLLGTELQRRKLALLNATNQPVPGATPVHALQHWSVSPSCCPAPELSLTALVNRGRRSSSDSVSQLCLTTRQRFSSRLLLTRSQIQNRL